MTQVELQTLADSIIPPGHGMGIDLGIVNIVRVLMDAGVETFESCEGGAGHSMPEPVVRFHGEASEGWRALAECLAHGLPAKGLRRYWDVSPSGEPTGPHWEITFRRSAVKGDDGARGANPCD
jgi:hypothetical protein